MKKTTSTSNMMNEILASAGKHMTLVTLDGITRKGKITGVNTTKIIYNQQELHIPKSIVINGDANDFVPLERIEKLAIY